MCSICFPGNSTKPRLTSSSTQRLIPQLSQSGGLRSLLLSEGTVMSRGGPSPYSRVLEVTFESLADWMAAVDGLNAMGGSPADLDRFRRLAPLVMFYEVTDPTGLKERDAGLPSCLETQAQAALPELPEVRKGRAAAPEGCREASRGVVAGPYPGSAKVRQTSLYSPSIVSPSSSGAAPSAAPRTARPRRRSHPRHRARASRTPRRPCADPLQHLGELLLGGVDHARIGPA